MIQSQVVEASKKIQSKKLRAIVAKLGLDGHDRGAKVVARALRDAGIEVIYLGVHQAPEDVVEAALEEDADVIGVSILSGSHIELVSDLLKLMKEKNLSIPVVVGGIIPPDDVEELKKMGVYEVLGPGTPLRRIVEIYKKAAEECGRK
ncbi:MAG: cobalamin B12-binding domain-containing protein [Desulfurococcales archaeon]|nr:cobalamin B12-binding domain-containing protein [Desulfurococcales archaeon]